MAILFYITTYVICLVDGIKFYILKKYKIILTRRVF